jgi:hypothetical protein
MSFQISLLLMKYKDVFDSSLSIKSATSTFNKALNGVLRWFKVKDPKLRSTAVMTCQIMFETCNSIGIKVDEESVSLYDAMIMGKRLKEILYGNLF